MLSYIYKIIYGTIVNQNFRRKIQELLIKICLYSLGISKMWANFFCVSNNTGDTGCRRKHETRLTNKRHKQTQRSQTTFKSSYNQLSWETTSYKTTSQELTSLETNCQEITSLETTCQEITSQETSSSETTS